MSVTIQDLKLPDETSELSKRVYLQENNQMYTLPGAFYIMLYLDNVLLSIKNDMIHFK